MPPRVTPTCPDIHPACVLVDTSATWSPDRIPELLPAVSMDMPSFNSRTSGVERWATSGGVDPLASLLGGRLRPPCQGPQAAFSPSTRDAARSSTAAVHNNSRYPSHAATVLARQFRDNRGFVDRGQARTRCRTPPGDGPLELRRPINCVTAKRHRVASERRRGTLSARRPRVLGEPMRGRPSIASATGCSSRWYRQW